MIKINYLWSWEKKRIKEQVAKKIEKEYKQKVENFEWNYTGDKVTSLYVYLEDGKPLYIRFDLCLFKIMTKSEDMSFFNKSLSITTMDRLLNMF